MKTELKTHALWNTLLCHNMMAQLPIDLFMQVKKFRQQSISYQNLFNHNFAFFNVGEFATLSLQASSFVFWFVHSFINSFIGSFDRSVFSSLPMWVIRSSCQPPSSFVRAFVRDIFRSSYCSFSRICLSIRHFQGVQYNKLRCRLLTITQVSSFVLDNVRSFVRFFIRLFIWSCFPFIARVDQYNRPSCMLPLQVSSFVLDIVPPFSFSFLCSFNRLFLWLSEWVNTTGQAKPSCLLPMQVSSFVLDIVPAFNFSFICSFDRLFLSLPEWVNRISQAACCPRKLRTPTSSNLQRVTN